MAKHKGDMLEALRATLRNAREEAAQAAALSASDSSAAPTGRGAQDPLPSPDAVEGLQGPPLPPPPSAGRDELAELDRQLAETRARRPGLGLLVLQVVALGTAFGLGRLSVSRPVAAEGGASRRVDERPASSGDEPALEAAAPSSASAPAAAADGTTADDRAFFDPQNLYTVQAITYADNDENLEQAWAVYDEFRRRGLPAIQPRRHRSNLVLFVGAAPHFDELAGVVAKVRESAGPAGRGRPFESALVVSIGPFR